MWSSWDREALHEIRRHSAKWHCSTPCMCSARTDGDKNHTSLQRVEKKGIKYCTMRVATYSGSFFVSRGHCQIIDIGKCWQCPRHSSANQGCEGRIDESSTGCVQPSVVAVGGNDNKGRAAAQQRQSQSANLHCVCHCRVL